MTGGGGTRAERVAAVAALRDAGLSRADIARELGISESTAARYATTAPPVVDRAAVRRFLAARAAGAPRWYDDAACRGRADDTFFPSGTDLAAITAARAVCARCPVTHACGQHALSVREPYGVWGGLTPAEREGITTGRPP